jgi:hypothetical protein
VYNSIIIWLRPRQQHASHWRFVAAERHKNAENPAFLLSTFGRKRFTPPPLQMVI